MAYSRKKFSLNLQTKVAALAASLSGIFYLLLHFYETNYITGSIVFGFGENIQQFPIALLASYLAGLLSYLVLHDHYGQLSRKQYRYLGQWRIDPEIQIFGVAVIIATAIFFGGEYLMSYRSSTIACLFIDNLYIDLLFALTSGLAIFLLVFETILDLERQACR